MAQILLVDDDENFRDILKDTIEQFDHKVTAANDVKSAQSALNLNSDIEVVISDIRMPGGTGIDLLHWIKKNSNLPVILMTGFSEILETKEAFELGAKGFLPKPFSFDDLLNTIDTCLAPDSVSQGREETGELRPNDELYCRVSIDDFVSGKEIPFCIYLRMGSNRYVKIAHKGEDISLDRIKSYKSKDVHYLHLTKEDFCKYIGFNIKIAKVLKNHGNISREKKQNFLKHTGDLILEKTHVAGVNQEIFQESKEFLNLALSLVSEDDDAFLILDKLNSHSDFLYAHSLGVSIYSVMIAKQAGWNSTPNIYKVGLGGLYHDIGKKEIPREILDKPRVHLTPKEIELIETHPKRGMELLSHTKGLPEDIAQIAYQHHELCTGDGYPRGLLRSKINPIAKLVCVANIFCEYAIANPQSEGMTGKEAISQLLMFRQEGLDPEFLNALKALFNYKEDTAEIKQTA